MFKCCNLFSVIFKEDTNIIPGKLQNVVNKCTNLSTGGFETTYTKSTAIEYSCGKRKNNTHHERFLLLAHCFQKSSAADASNGVCKLERLK